MKALKVGKSTLNLIDCELVEKKDPIKQELLRIVRDTNVLEYPGIIEQKACENGETGYNFLYHLSDMRGNVVRWLPIDKYDSVLEMEAECGGITAALIKLSENVSVYTSSATDAEILAERFSFCKNFVIYAGTIEASLPEIESANGKFDWIIVRNPELLPYAGKLVKDTGRVIFITDNRMGMRNLAGVKADGTDEYFSGVEGKTQSGFTFAGLRKLFAMTGFEKAQMYYPYPDYRFMKNLYSNQRLPKVGELTINEGSLSSDRFRLFSEKEAFDASCEDGSFQYYSNSYLVVLGEPVYTEYARFSNDRAPEFSIFTSIENRFGERKVKKQPITEAAENHIRNLPLYYEKLAKRYEGSALRVNKCNLMEYDGRVCADFEYVNGVELSKLMDMCLSQGDIEGFYKLFDKYVSLTGHGDDENFADIDMVFSNILVSRNEWTLIDYEWCKESKISVKETAYRAIYCYLLEDPDRKKFNLDLLRDKLVLSNEASEEIEKDEMIFQKHVTGRNLSLFEIQERLGFKSIDPLKMQATIKDDKGIYIFKIYPGSPTGEFSENTAYVVSDAYVSDNLAKVNIGILEEENIMRVDPMDSPCLVCIRTAKLGELDFPFDNKKYVYSNGKRIGDRTFVFSTSDPNLYFDLTGFIHNEDTFLYLELEVTPLATDTAEAIAANIKRIF